MIELPGKSVLYRKFAESNLPITLLLMGLTFVVFGRALSHEFLNNWDDPLYVLHNEAIRGFSIANIKTAFSTFYVGNYAPVQILSYMLDYTLWGLKAYGFILTNITLHAFNGILLYTFLKKLKIDSLAAIFATLVFIVHPVQVESVVWISQRKNLLAMFFFLLSFHFYCKWRSEPDHFPGLTYALSLLAFVLSLLTKSVAVTLPLALLVYDWIYHSGERRRDTLTNKLPYLVAALIVSAVALVSQSPEAGGGRAPFHGGSAWATGLTMITVLGRYLSLIVWPTSLSAIYDPPVKSAIDGGVLLALAVILLIAAVTYYLIRCRSQEVLWVALIFTGLLPVSQIVPIVTLMNDRYLYFPMIGVAGLCGSLATRVRSKVSPFSYRMLISLWGVAIIALAVLAFNRVPVWKSSLQLWGDAVDKSPSAYTAWAGLGEAHHNDGRLDEAQYAYLRSLSLKPTNSDMVNNLGVLFLDKGQPLIARQFLLPLLKDHPENFSALLNLGDSYFMDGDLAEAERYYSAAHDLKPNAPKPMAFLGGVFFLQGNQLRAEEYFRQAVKSGLGIDYIAFYKASILSRAGHSAEAIAYLKEAIRLGYTDFASMSWDINFDSIRTSKEYQMLISAMNSKKVEVNR